MMLQVVTSSGKFGPYSTVDTLIDRYKCDGADLPFTVVGEGVVDEWTGPLPVPAPAPMPVPQSISPRQIRQALTLAGLRAGVESAVAAGGQDIKDWWEFSTAFERTNPQVIGMAAALGVTDAALDDLWKLGATL